MVDDGNEPIAVLLTDLMLPGMMGDALASHLVARQPELRVIAMSGSSARTTDVTRVSTVFLVDVSESVTDASLETAERIVRAAYEVI